MGLKPVELFIPLGKKPKRCWKKTTTSKSLDISHVRKFYKWIGQQATEAYMFPLHTKWLLQNEEKLLLHMRTERCMPDAPYRAAFSLHTQNKIPLLPKYVIATSVVKQSGLCWTSSEKLSGLCCLVKQHGFPVFTGNSRGHTMSC